MNRLLLAALCTLLPGLAAADPFVDVAESMGITFTHRTGAEGKRYLPETYGSGVAFLDYDNDGFLDLYLVNGGRLPGLSQAPLADNALYRNSQGRSFTDVTQETGAGDQGYGMGVAVGDYDNDGDVDVYLSNFGPNSLLRNLGGRFEQVAGQVGVADEGWGSSAAFADVDLDGQLDLYVANYLSYPVVDPLACTVGNTAELLYCDPRKFDGQEDRLYRNMGPEKQWHFTDWTKEAGLLQTSGKELGVVFGDFDLDGDPDLYLANDLTPNALFRNDGGRFTRRGLASGTSHNDEGQVEAGMGVDMGDVDGDGFEDIFVTNFQWESNTLYRQVAPGYYVDDTVPSGINALSLPFLGFGAGFFDSDKDGDLDLYVANGHVYDNVEKVDQASSYAQRNQLLHNLGDGRFDTAANGGPGMDVFGVSRGVAFGDFDNDGDVDIAVTNSDGKPNLLRNEAAGENHWLGIKLRGRQSNRDGIGAVVILEAGGRRQTRQLRSAASYLSAHDTRLFFGLGKAPSVEEIEVRWPSGVVQRVQQVQADQYLVIEEKSPL